MRQATQGELGAGTTHSTDAIIHARRLAKSYGDTRALENLTFTVRAGEVFGYLGPNGAGKTTTINILSGLLARDAGEVSICGMDIALDPVSVKQRIGVVPEESNLYPELSCRRNLEYLGELYGLSRSHRRARSHQLLEAFGLEERAAAPFRTLSRGMRRRLTLAAALVHSPEVLFLDEPTTGLDVPGARALRSLVQTLRNDRTTVFLTTHNLAEAEELCDRVLILVQGRVLAEGTAAEIRQRVEKVRILSVVFSGRVTERSLREACPAVRAAAAADGRWRLEVSDTHAGVAQVVSFAEREGIQVVEIETDTPSFEDAFMTLLEGKREGNEL